MEAKECAARLESERGDKLEQGREGEKETMCKVTVENNPLGEIRQPLVLACLSCSAWELVISLLSGSL